MAQQRTHKTTGERSQQNSREGATTETSYTYTDDGKCWFSSDERKTITRIRKLKEAHPDEVTILKQPEENDGCIYGWLDKKQFNLYPNHKMDLSDEQRAKLAERFKNAQQSGRSGEGKQGDTP